MATTEMSCPLTFTLWTPGPLARGERKATCAEAPPTSTMPMSPLGVPSVPARALASSHARSASWKSGRILLARIGNPEASMAVRVLAKIPRVATGSFNFRRRMPAVASSATGTSAIAMPSPSRCVRSWSSSGVTASGPAAEGFAAKDDSPGELLGAR